MNCNTTHYRANSSSVPGDPTNNATITGWTTNNPARVGLNPLYGGSSPIADNGEEPDGVRVAFIQGTSGETTTLSTTITGLTVGKTYQVQFRANRRVTGGTVAPQPAYRLNGGAAVPFYMGLGVGGDNPYYFIKGLFTATATTAALEVSSTSTGTSYLLVDNFIITAATAIQVTNANDSSPVPPAGSLRKALADAQASAVPNVITFAAALNGATINLVSQIQVNDPNGVCIDASALANGIKIVPSTGIRPFFNAIGSLCSMRKVTIEGANFGSHAGAILNEGVMELTQCRFLGNAAGGVGGAVFNGAAISVTDCVFSGNTSTVAAAALLHQGNSATVTRCTFINNHADALGGAIYATAPGLSITACTFHNNTSNDAGGAIYLDQLAVATLTHCTLSGNTGAYGGAISNHGTITVKNCIIAGNTATVNGSTADVENNGFASGKGVFTREGANIIPSYADTAGGTNSGPVALIGDPLLSAPANNGGLMQTMEIASTSPARSAAVGSTSTADQRGFPVVGTADLGAFEVQAGGTFNLGATTYDAFEGGVAEIVINRAGNIAGIVTVRLTTTAGTAAATDFTARANTAASDVTFLDGETVKTVAIPLPADSLNEANEMFTVTLTSPTPAGTALGAPLTATVTIKNSIMVNTTADQFDTPSGAQVSLREALRDAEAAAGANGIGFAPALAGQVITITTGFEFVVMDQEGVVVDASSIGGITINGGTGANRIFMVDEFAILSLRRLTLTGGGPLVSGLGGGGSILSGFGGAILVNTGAVLGLTECVLSGNAAADFGGAIATTTGTLTLTRCTLSGNTARYGGAVYSDTPTGDGVTQTRLIQCTLSGNNASAAGGAVYNALGITRINHCTIAANTAPADYGSGVASRGDVSEVETVVENSIIAANTNSSVDLDVDNINNGNSFTSLGYNIIGAGGATGDFVRTGDQINTDPLVGPLANYGGVTQTHALLSNSPALNHATGSTITGDQRGFVIQGVADSGAFESGQGGVFLLANATYRVHEGQPVTVTINRSGAFIGPATVRLFTANVTAVGGTDYVARANASASDVTFADGEITRNVVINTITDATAEPANETFTVSLGLPAPASASTVGSPSTATVTVVDPILVTNLNDDGPGSLRKAFVTAAANATPDIITFAAALGGQTITLGSELAVDDAFGLTVNASNLAAGITIDGGPGANRVFDVGNGGPTSVTLRGLTVTGGNGGASGQPGGAIFNRNGSTLTLVRCTLVGNDTSNAPGGAIQNEGSAVLEQCTLSGNSAIGVGVAGGAILNTGSVTLTHCTLSKNYTDGSGGGICNFGLLTMNDSILGDNTASANPASGDIFNGNIGTVDFEELTIVQNFLNAGTVEEGGNQIPADPKVLPLAANGGPTKTHALRHDSPAIDAATGATITTDQRGLPIISTADVGAFEGQLGGTFVLEMTGYTAEESQGATIRILRLGGTQGSASVRLFTTNGTALAGDTLDYDSRPNTAVSDVFFNEGDTGADVNVTTNIDGIVEANENFTVSLGSPSPGTVLGTPSSANVSIQDPSSGSILTDAAKPTVAFTAPAAGGSVNVDVGGKFTVTGTATDNKGVQHVGIYLNGVAQGNALLEKPSATSTSFSMVLGPGGFGSGVNTVEARPADGAGNELNPGPIRSFKVLRPLLVNISGHGSVTSGFAPTSYREVGAPITLTAAAGTGYLFAGWTVLSTHTLTQIGTNAAALDKTTLTFVHREGLMLRANFVPNPYTLANTGTFNGAIKPNLSARDITTEGYITVLVQPTGAFSGSLKLDGLTLAVAGTFDPAGAARFGTSRAKTLSVARAEKPSLSVSLHIDIGTGKITGTVAQFDSSTLSIIAKSDVDADRASFSAATPVPPNLGYLVPDVAYNVQFIPDEPGQQPAGYGQAEFPNGFGHATAKVTKAGVVTVTGLLPDGTAITASTTLSQTYRFRLFAQLYGVQGIVAGTVEFTNIYTDIDFAAFDSLWIRPVQNVQHYPGGWPAGLSLDVGGTKWIVPAGESVMRPLPILDGDGNAKLTFSDGVSGAIVKTMGISETDVVTNLPLPMDTSFTLKIDRLTGTFSGTFTLNDGVTKLSYKGVIKNKNVGVGYGYALTPIPAVKDYNGRSWRVTLEAQ